MRDTTEPGPTSARRSAQRRYFASPKGKLARIRADVRRSYPRACCTLTLEEWESLREMYDACVYCGRPFSEEHPALVGNAIPLSRRGDHAFENVYPSCRTCLYRKKDKTMDEYFEYLDRKGTAPTRG